MTAPAATEAGRRAPASRRAEPQRARRALVRVEAARMARHPAFLLGLLATLAMAGLRRREIWAGYNYYLTTTAWAFTWMGALAAGALAAGRQRFLSDPDLFPAVPTTRRDRVLATATALAGPALVTAIVVGAVAALTVLRDGFPVGDDGYGDALVPPLVEWVQPVLLVVVAGAVGVALAQLRRARLTALIFVLVATLLGGWMVWLFGAHPFRVLHPFMYPSYEQQLPQTFDPATWSPGDPPLLAPTEWTTRWREVGFDSAALGWHLLYLVGMVLLLVWWAARAAAREGDDRGPPSWLLRAGLPLLLVGGVAQVLTAGTNS